MDLAQESDSQRVYLYAESVGCVVSLHRRGLSFLRQQPCREGSEDQRSAERIICSLPAPTVASGRRLTTRWSAVPKQTERSHWFGWPRCSLDFCTIATAKPSPKPITTSPSHQPNSTTSCPIVGCSPIHHTNGTSTRSEELNERKRTCSSRNAHSAVEQFSNSEIAKLLKRNESTNKANLSIARKKMRQQIVAIGIVNPAPPARN